MENKKGKLFLSCVDLQYGQLTIIKKKIFPPGTMMCDRLKLITDMRLLEKKDNSL